MEPLPRAGTASFQKLVKKQECNGRLPHALPRTRVPSPPVPYDDQRARTSDIRKIGAPVTTAMRGQRTWSRATGKIDTPGASQDTPRNE